MQCTRLGRLLVLASGMLFLPAGMALSDATKHVAIMTMVDTPQLIEVKNGVLKGLAAHGYVEGKNLAIEFQSAQSKFGTAQQIARKFIGENPDVIVTITTPPTQAVITATKDIPVIFSAVTDPIGAKLVPTAT